MGNEASAILTIDTLLSPYTLDTFLANAYRAPVPQLISGSKERAAALMQIPELRSVESLAKVWHKEVLLWGAGVDELGYGPSQVLAKYKAGFTAVFEYVEDFVPAVRPMLRNLEHAFGAPAGSISMGAFASKKGHGAEMHFDREDVFNIQLKGTKRWRVAANRHFDVPHEPWAPGAPISPSLAEYAKRPLPERMPDDASVISVGPGEMVFNPRGTWHAVEALDDSWSIAFEWRTPPWGFFVIEKLIAGLFGDIATRRWPHTLTRAEHEAALLAEAEAAIAQVRKLAGNLTAEDLIADLRARVPAKDAPNPHVPRPSIAMK